MAPREAIMPSTRLFFIVDDLAFAFDIVLGLADQDAVFVLGGDLFDAIYGFGEEFFLKVGEDDADGEGLALFEEDGGLVRFVIQFGG